MAELRTVEDVWRMVEALPGAAYCAQAVPFDAEGWTHVYPVARLPTDRGELEALLPFRVDVDVPADGLEAPFVRALGVGPASIYWDGIWPDVPELGLTACAKHEAVQAVFNSDDADFERPAQDHTVFVHLSHLGDLPRAQWLADQVGAKILGKPVPGR